MIKKSLILLIIGLSFMATGCARSYVGTYTGTETIQQNGQNSTLQATASITTDSGSLVNGTISANGSSGTFTAQNAGSGALNSVNLLVSNAAVPTTGGAVQSVQICAGTYVGNLTMNNNLLSGTLTASAQSGGISYCNASLVLNLTRSN